jgi:benzodiazapine receptor
MGYSSHLIARIATETLSEPQYVLARAGLGIYAVQVGVNLLWTPTFFGARDMAGGLFDIGGLLGLVGGMTLLFFEVDYIAGCLCLPYLAWIGFASYLNYSLLKLNPDK